MIIALLMLGDKLTSEVSCARAPLSPPLCRAVRSLTLANGLTDEMTLNSAEARSAVARPLDLGHARPGSLYPTAAPAPGQRRGAVGTDCGGAIYTRAELLRLRGAAAGPPLLDPVVSLLRRLGLCRGRRRGVRAGRKSRRPIGVVVSTRRERGQGAVSDSDRIGGLRRPADERCLALPPRLSLR